MGFPVRGSEMTMSPVQDSVFQPDAVVQSASSHKKHNKVKKKLLNTWQRIHQEYHKLISNWA